MVSNEIRNNAAALGVLMHQVSEEQAAMLRLIKTNLVAAADTAAELERGLLAPAPQFKVVNTMREIEIDEESLKRAAQRTKRKILRILGALPSDCPGECEGCSHAKEAANGQN